METCAISIQSWSYIKRSWTNNTINIHTMVEETTQVITEAIKLAYNGVQYSNRKTGIQTCAYCTICILQKASHSDSPSSTNSSESLHTAEEFNNCRHPKANRQTTTLSTQALDKALTCCVKMVQQRFLHTRNELMEQEVAATSSLKQLLPFIQWSGRSSKKRMTKALYTSLLTLRRLMSYIYGAPILDVSRSHATTQHSR